MNRDGPESMFSSLHKYASPQRFYRLAGHLTPWIGWLSLSLFLAGLYTGLVVAPPDYQQGDSYRIMFIHVPAAWLSLLIYVIMAGASASAMIWRVKVMELVAHASAPVGALFTFLALVTGSLWGKPMWGAWWVWDARLTSELILLFLYLGYLALEASIEDKRVAARAAGVLSLVGVVNIPIIHYSVQWWNTLHQGPTVFKAGGPSIALSMLIPLLIMAAAFHLYYLINLLQRVRCGILERERDSGWVRELVAEMEPNAGASYRTLGEATQENRT